MFTFCNNFHKLFTFYHICFIITIFISCLHPITFVLLFISTSIFIFMPISRFRLRSNLFSESFVSKLQVSCSFTLVSQFLRKPFFFPCSLVDFYFLNIQSYVVRSQ